MPISEEQLLEWIKDFDSKNIGAQHLTYIHELTQEELYGKNATIEKNGRISGAYHPKGGSKGLVTFVLGHLRDESEFRETINHEIYGHYGTLTFTRDEKRKLLEVISDSRQSPSMLEKWKYIDKQYPDANESLKAEEMFCFIAEDCLEQASKSKFFDAIWNDIVINKKRLLEIHHLEIICDAVAYGIRTGERQQQIFPKNNQSQYRLEGKEEQEQKFNFANSNLQTNLNSLKNDQRFSKHTLNELGRIAFCRSIFILEKENLGLQANLSEFDQKMTNRNIASKLPELPLKTSELLSQIEFKNKENISNSNKDHLSL